MTARRRVECACRHAFVEPLARLLTADGWHGRAFPCINAEINTNLRSHRPEILELHRATAGLDAYQRLWSAHDLSSTAPVPESLRDERTRVGAMMLLHALADQARLWSDTEPSEDDGAACAANLTDMFLGATLAPATPRPPKPSP
ncbi:hypothetical protein GCM10023205_46770 [Yinghuangia aomiensis]|uniref:TetR family transcriptional regulator n=1 Tax=Yinghuangia aomiensis TaxID=676205 RepID=A0ABP9HN08_9ACTN